MAHAQTAWVPGFLPASRGLTLVGTTGIFATAGFLLWTHVLVATLRQACGARGFRVADEPARPAGLSHHAGPLGVSP